MSETLKSLPEDKEALKKIIFENQKEIERLREQIKLLQHRKFSKKSEVVNEKQISLFDEPEIIENEKTETVEITAYSRKKHNRALPSNLPKEQKIYDLEEDEKICQCGCELSHIGEDKYEQLEYIPAQVKIIEHIKKKYACKKCQANVKTANMPKQPIPKSIASPGLLSHTIVAKYIDHLPLYRQEAIFKRLNIDLPRATFSNWIFKCAELLKPIVNLLRIEIINDNYAQADETTVNVLSEKDNRTNCYMWVFMAGPPGSQSVVFEYHKTRNSDIPLKFFENYSGFLQTDGYSGYNSLRDKKSIISVGCWAHARRKFFEITKISKTSGSAHIGLKFINKLYGVEHKANELNLSYENRKMYREENSKPILGKFKSWLEKTILRVPPKSALSKAMAYTMNNWEALNNYCLDGKITPDNNAIERMIKPFACGRKNWLFQGNTRGAEASAILYSLAQTCKINKIDPYKYFKFALTNFPLEKGNANLKKYLPYNIES